MKRKKELRRSPGYRMPRRAMQKRGTRVRPINRQRKAKAFAHAYHSDERVAWVKTLPCAWCGRVGRTANAHTGKKPGKGLKAHYSTIAPLCDGPGGCHDRFDEYLPPFDEAAVRDQIIAAAAATERAWQHYINQRSAAA